MSDLRSGRNGNASVLIVEDEALIAFYLEDTLDELGYPCCGIAETAEQAVSLATAERPDVAFVDIGLRGTRDGVAVAAELRELGVTIVFLTGAADPETRQRAEAVRPHGILSKPCNHIDIAGMLESAGRALTRQ
jgi:DNA-binding NarL/FixJ family response regulator